MMMRVTPPDDLVDLSRPIEELQHEVYQRLCDLSATLVTPLIETCIAEDEAFNDQLTDLEQVFSTAVPPEPHTCMQSQETQQQVSTLYKQWLECAVLNMEHVFTINERHTIGMHMFVELMRLHWLMHRASLLKQQYAVVCECPAPDLYYSVGRNNKHPSWALLRNTFEGVESTNNDAEGLTLQVQQLEHIWTRPIFALTQSELVHVILFLTQHVEQVPCTEEAIAELRKTTTLVCLRTAVIMQEAHPESVLDSARFRQPASSSLGVGAVVQEYIINESFIAFASFYLLSLLRRFFYLDIIPIEPCNQLMDARERLSELGRAWVQRIVDGFAEEAAEDLYMRQIEPGYLFVGDDHWYRYAFPQRVHSRGACITELRPHLHKRFYSEDKLNMRVVLASTSSSAVARLFVLASVDEYVRVHCTNVEWHQAVVVFNHEIEKCAIVMRDNAHPYLMQVFSSAFWLYNGGSVILVTDDVYLAIAAWFHVLHYQYDATLLRRSLLRFTKECLRV